MSNTCQDNSLREKQTKQRLSIRRFGFWKLSMWSNTGTYKIGSVSIRPGVSDDASIYMEAILRLGV